MDGNSLRFRVGIRLKEKIFIFISFTVFSGAFLHFLSFSDGSSESNIFIVAILFLIYFYSFLILIYSCRLNKSDFSTNLFLILLYLFCFISILWSSFPLISLRKYFNLFGTLIFGFYLIKRFDLLTILKILYFTILFLGIISFLFIILVPELGLMNASQNKGLHIGAWKGVFEHKNIFGRLMALQVLLSFFLYRYSNNKYYFFTILFSMLMIVGSRSSSSLVFSILSIVICYSVNNRGQIRFIFKLIFILLITSFSVIITNFEAIVLYLGKDITLTGRTIMWEQLFEAYEKRPILGYGFNGFWPGALDFSYLTWIEAPHSHNILLDLGLDLGIVGVLLFLGFYFNSLFRMFNGKTFIYVWGISFFLFIGLFNLIESNLVRGNSIYWLIMIFTSFYFNKINNYKQKKLSVLTQKV